jgi:DNA-directed RNA polymerase subunit RPC12/RpoP
MDERKLSRTQRFFIRFVDADTAAAIEAHSRGWILTCPHCGFQRSIWDLGGIRYKASGNSRMAMRCPQCGRRGWHKLRKADDFPTTRAPAWPIVRLILVIGLAVFILGAVLFRLIPKLLGTI